ncbi:MAG: hypothetical protein IKZ86_04205 [Spirochaetaceae bacterium]|nr:hypothetical protein [Spirochaetaceae bacterium]
MKKVILILVSLFLVSFCFANGRCEKLEKEILKNPNVIEVGVGQHDKWTQEIYFAYITLTNDRYIKLVEFDRYLSGERLCIECLGNNPEKKFEYEFIRIDCIALSALFNKNISTVNDIINNYDEIYKLAATLAKETPEERTQRKNMKCTDSGYTDRLGNYKSDKRCGYVFARYINEPFESMFADE